MRKPRASSLVTVGLCLGTTLNPLNSSMIAVALVMLRDEFALDMAGVTWAITVFYLASATAQPLMGRFADRFGAKRLFSIGMLLVIISCATAPFSSNFTLICFARVFLAMGTSTVFPGAVLMISELSQQYGSTPVRRLATIRMAGTAGAALGPVIGGLLVGLLGWQALFYINIPLALAALLSMQFAPADRASPEEPWEKTLRDSDAPGILSFIIGLLLLMMAALNAVPGFRGLLMSGGLIVLALFTWRELRTRKPFLDLTALSLNRPLLLVYLCYALFNTVYYTVFFGLPQLLEESAGYSPEVVGLLMLPLAAVSVVATPTAARAIERWGVRGVMIAGVTVLSAASASLGVLTLSMDILVVVIVTALMGIPYATANIAASQGMYASAPESDKGVAAGLFQTFRFIGSISATITLGLLYGSGVNPTNWARLVITMLALNAITLALAWIWHPEQSR